MPKRAILCGYYGKGNAGDEALLAALLQMLPEGITPVVLSGNPKETRLRFGVESCDRMSAFAILREFRRSHVFILGGGSLLQDATSFRNPFYYAGLVGLAKAFGLQAVAWAQGVGPLDRNTSQWLAKRALSGCTQVSVRDGRSAALLNEWGISVTFAPDPVWALAATPIRSIQELPAPRVAITLRSHPQLTPSRLDTLARALTCFQEATKATSILLPFHKFQDMAIAEWLHARLPRSQLLRLRDPREFAGVYQDVDMAIGMRLHALVMAAAQGCRCHAISYDPKVTQLMAEFDLPGWKLTELPQDANAICKAWLQCYTDGEALPHVRVRATVDRALVHRELLQVALR